MPAALDSPSVARVRQALAQAGLRSEIVELPGAARTAKAAAGFLGCDVAQIANSLVFRAHRSDAAILVMSSGACKVDIGRLSEALGEPAGKADADFVRERTGFAIGGVPPLGHVAPLRTFIEGSLAAQNDLWAAAGHPHTVFRLTYAQLLLITGGTPIAAAVK
jgi:prolyl-tRNA editing enzyme YbaK/EbsC (Cys-tRNA(Pro) deacylase)